MSLQGGCRWIFLIVFKISHNRRDLVGIIETVDRSKRTDGNGLDDTDAESQIECFRHDGRHLVAEGDSVE